MSKLEEQLKARLAAREKRSQLRKLTTFPAENVDFSSNAYLSLSSVPEVRSAYHSLVENHAAPPPLLGSGGSRLLDGNSQLAEDLERDIAAFHNAPAGLLFNSGFDANCVEGDGGLDSVLKRLGHEKSVFVLIEGVYSMDGDVAPLKEVVDCVKRRLPSNGYIIVDEAHSTGIFGTQGRGLVCEMGLEKDIFARLHTFGKAMSSFGGKS
jgi:8-amino-7-oxononanoate synthase